MKQRDLIKKLKRVGFEFQRYGGSHDIYTRGTEKKEIPKHKEINEKLAKAILRK